MSSSYQALSIPPAANTQGGVEVLRCAVIDGELHLTLRPAFSEPNGWGQLFAEVARQVARAYAHERRFTEPETLARISSAFEANMRQPPEATSTISPLGKS
jgi:Domain of unknown function (DUF5076)